MEETNFSNKTSFANSAYAQIYRFDEIKKRAQRFALQSNHFLWNIELDNMWRELAPDLLQKYEKKQDTVKKKYDEIKEINIRLIKTFPLIGGSTGNGFNKTSMQRNLQIGEQYQILNEKEIWLGELQNELGKGTKWADEDADSM
jgi:hypothetical protein